MADDRKARYRDISEGLLRQRRNLLLISLMLPLFFISGADIQNINILGTVITIKKPEAIRFSLVALFLYFLWRYCQYYLEETYVNDMHRRIHEYLYTWENRYLNKKARKMASFLNSDFVRVCFADPRYSWGGRYVAIPENRDKVVFPFRRMCEFYIHPANDREGHEEEQIKKFHSDMAQAESAGWTALKTSDDPSHPPGFYRNYLTYSIIKFNIMRLVGYCRYILSESYFTDYQLPFIVAIVSALITIYAVFI